MRAASEGHRQHFLDGLRRFAVSVRELGGVRRIALLNSIVTAKPDPKDVDVLVVVADDADLAPLATCARRLQGHAQSFNRGADVFLVDERGTYIGRTCRWKDCLPGVRQSCDALHCGRRPYLHGRSRCDSLEQHPGSFAARHAVAIGRASWPITGGRRRSCCGSRTHRLTSHAPEGARRFLQRRW